MKARRAVLLTVLLSVMVPMISRSQTPIVTVNGLSSGASLHQGDTLSWQIAVPTGAAVDNQLWLDVNGNGRVDTSADRLIFAFTQQDGVGSSNGPGDMDSLANGVITTSFVAGIAPAQWVFVSRLNSQADTVAFTVTQMTSPAARITGQIVGDAGIDKSYIVIEANSTLFQNGGPDDPFWDGVTDVSGAFTIDLGGTPTDLNPWRVRINRTPSLGRLVFFPQDTTVSVGAGNPTVQFQAVLGTLLTGKVETTTGDPIPGAYPHLHLASDPTSNGNIGGDTDPSGHFAFAAPPGNWYLHFTANGYTDMWWNGKTSSSNADIIAITTQDTIANLNVQLSLIPTSVRENPGTPEAFVLHPAFPNPFNPSCQITYDVPVTASVRLSIFNVLGQEVAVLVSGSKNPGTYSVTWSASDVPSGIYFCQFRAGDVVRMQKLVLMK